MAKSKPKKTKKKTTREKPDETSSPSEKISYLIELLTKIDSGFETLEIYGKARGKARKELRRMMSQAEKDLDDWISADYEEDWKKTGLEIQEASNEAWAILLCQQICAFRSEAYLTLQSDTELQNFIAVNSEQKDKFCQDLPETGMFKDNLLQRVQSIVHDSIEAAEFGGLVEQLELICRRGETKPASERPKTRVEAPGSETESVKKRFTLNEDQILFDHKDIEIPAGPCVKIASLLIKAMPRIVKNSILNKASDEPAVNDAQDKLRSHISLIKKQFKKHKVSCQPQGRRGAGYLIILTKPHTRKRASR